MCGIVAIIKKNLIVNYNIYNLLSNIKERGPDNFSIYDTRNILLIHSRLAIQNTGITELQPYQYNNNILCFNGEIYNTKYLADKYKLDYNIDTDLICKLYESNKSNFVNIIKEFDGIFAFIIYDVELHKTIIATDAFNVKSLYTYEDDNIIAFSSNVNTIYEFANTLEINNDSLYAFVNFRQCINNKTLIRGIDIVPSGIYIDINLHNYNRHSCKYFDLIENPQEFSHALLKTKLDDSITSNMLADDTIKVGCFLSGGVDSSYIYKLLKGKYSNLYSYSIGFDNCNEFEFVKMITENEPLHKNLQITIPEYLNHMVELIKYKGMPLQVPNEVLISQIAKQARADNVTVLLAGEGADEIFHGYGKIFNMCLNTSDEIFIDSFVKEYKYNKNDNIFNFDLTQIKLDVYDFFNKYNMNNMHKQNLLSYIFLQFHINGLTSRLDNSTMYNSIEARVPFLNQSLVKYVFNSVPIDEKIKRTYDPNGTYSNYKELSEVKDTPKFCLKKIAEQILPKEIIYRKKVGFNVPIEDLNNKHIKYLLHKILDCGDILSLNAFNVEHIKNEMQTNPANIKYLIFNLINLEIFVQLFISKRTVEYTKEFILEKRKIVGYTCGVYDLFHVGHLNLLKNAREHCDYLIVSVTPDENVAYKGKTAFINETDRYNIVNSCKYVDKTVFQTTHDKFKAWEQYKYDILFVGDDWKGHPNWIRWEQQLNEVGAKVVYFPYTTAISSTHIRNSIQSSNDSIITPDK